MLTGTIINWINKQTHRFCHALVIFGMATILILVLTTKDIGNLVPAVALLIVFGIVWAGITGFNFEADKRVPESTQTVEVDEEWGRYS